MMERFVRWFAAVGLAVFVCLPRTGYAQGSGDLVVSPTRIVFEGRTRSAQVTLANRGSATSTFRISLVDMSMDDDGQMRQLSAEEKPDTSAAGLVRYAPRQIDIPPGATQVVRLSLRKPSDLADGEYRSHMFFRAVPPEGAGRSVTDETPLQEGELRIQLIPIYGVTIPVIVRNGQLSANAKLDQVTIQKATEQTPKQLLVELSRTGTQSTFGDLVATYIPAGGGEPVVVGRISRLAVYTPNSIRRVAMVLRVPDGVTLKAGGRIHVTYRETEEEGGKMLAEQDLAL